MVIFFPVNFKSRKMRKLLTLVSLTLTLFVQAQEVKLFGDIVRGDYSGISLTPPPEIEFSQISKGLFNESLKIGITFFPDNGSYRSRVARFTKEILRQDGIELKDAEAVWISELEGRIMKLDVSTGNGNMVWFILMFGDEERTYRVTGVFPKELDAQFESSIKKSLLSTKLISTSSN